MLEYPLRALKRRGMRLKWKSARSQHAHPAREGTIRTDLVTTFGLSQKQRSTSHVSRCVLFLALTTPLRM